MTSIYSFYLFYSETSGIQRDHDRTSLLVLSIAIGTSDPLISELHAVKEALNMYAPSKWANVSNLVIESDCLNVVNLLKTLVTPSVVGKKLNNRNKEKYN